MKPKVALVRGKFLNQYEMQVYEPLVDRYNLTAFGSMYPFHEKFAFPVVKLWSPMDLSSGTRSGFARRITLSILNRLCMDAHYLLGLEKLLDGFDIAHSAETYYHYTTQCLNTKRDGRVRAVVTTVLETIPFNNEGIWGRKSMKARARKEVDHFIAISNRAKDALIKEGTDPNKITVIPYGIDTKRFIHHHVDNDKTMLHILFVGRLEVEKGVLDVLEAFIQVSYQEKAFGKRLHLTIVGTGSLKAALIARIKMAGVSDKVTLKTSSYNDMPKVYQKADIFVAPSKPHFPRLWRGSRGKSKKIWEEQYNIALLEAQSSGLAIITTHCGAIPENVSDCAILIDPDDTQALVNALTQLITNPKLRLSLGISARHRAETVHDISLVSQKIDNLYKEVLFSVKAKTK